MMSGVYSFKVFRKSDFGGLFLYMILIVWMEVLLCANEWEMLVGEKYRVVVILRYMINGVYIMRFLKLDFGVMVIYTI